MHTFYGPTWTSISNSRESWVMFVFQGHPLCLTWVWHTSWWLCWLSSSTMCWWRDSACTPGSLWVSSAGRISCYRIFCCYSFINDPLGISGQKRKIHSAVILWWFLFIECKKLDQSHQWLFFQSGYIFSALFPFAFHFLKSCISSSFFFSLQNILRGADYAIEYWRWCWVLGKFKSFAVERILRRTIWYQRLLFSLKSCFLSKNSARSLRRSLYLHIYDLSEQGSTISNLCSLK